MKTTNMAEAGGGRGDGGVTGVQWQGGKQRSGEREPEESVGG